MNGWFARLFPDISFPAQRVSGVIDRTVAQFKALQKDGGDVKTFLQEECDLDFEMLSSLGLKRGHLLADTKAVKPPEGFECTNQVIIDLENFRSREKLALKFTVKWVQLLSSGENISDTETEKSIKKVIDEYRTLNRHRSRAPDKVVAFLSSRFSAARSPPSSSTSQPLPPSDNQVLTKKLQQLQQEKDPLLQCSKSWHQDIQTLQDTVHELSAEKKLLEVPNTIHELEQELDRLRECSNVQKRTSQLRYNAKRRACNEAKRRLQRQQRENDELRATQNQLQRNVELLGRELERERDNAVHHSVWKHSNLQKN